MNEILGSYVEDLRDSLMLFNEALMLLDQGSTDDETINRVFRVAHTIKGNSAAMEFFKVEKVMHTMEDILHEVREHKRELTSDIIEIQYRCHDFLEDFMEILLEDENDDRVQPEELLKDLLKIKNGGEQEEAITEPQKAVETLEFVDEVFSNIDGELIEVIEKNIDMGMSAYELEIEFVEDVQMKSIRTFMLFQKIEASAMIVYSNPVAPTEEDFSTGKFEFDGKEIKALILTDSNIDDVVADIQEDFTVDTVSAHKITKNKVHQETASASVKIEIINAIKEIEVDVLDVQKSEINNEAVSRMLDKLNKICEVSNKLDCNLLREASIRLINILETTSIENKKFPPEDAQTVAYVLEDLSTLAKDTSLENDSLLVKNIEKNISLLEENILDGEVKTGELLKAKGILSEGDIEQIVDKQKESKGKLKFGQVAVKEKKVSAVQMTEVLKEKDKSAKERSTSRSKESTRQIRVSESKVDNLLDMLGELTILNSQLDQQVEANGSKSAEIANTISRTSKIIRSVQDLSMSLRLIQIKNTLFRLTRIVRDTAHELNKKVNIVITGDEIEIDRSAAEKVFDPLMHLVRNAVSHGIESPEDRVKAGKPAEGKVEINAYSKRGSVYIEVKDDGKGIDPEKVLAKAIKLGLADSSTEYTEAEKIDFIMQPGFSTQVEVNNISGRGVGMNVVESELMKIGGKVEIENDFGNGCAFIIRIPMNLALVNGTIVEISEENYIIPTLFIKQFYIKEEDEWISMQGKKRAIKIRDNIIPIISEEAIFNRKKESKKERKQIIILEMEKHLLGLPVDNIVGRQDIVSKPLDSELAQAKVLSGASILGDGKVSLILDVEALYKIAGY